MKSTVIRVNNIINFQVARRLDLNCSQDKKEIIIM